MTRRSCNPVSLHGLDRSGGRVVRPRSMRRGRFLIPRLFDPSHVQPCAQVRIGQAQDGGARVAVRPACFFHS